MAEGKDSSKQMYPLKIVIPPSKSRLIFFASSREMAMWTQRF